MAEFTPQFQIKSLKRAINADEFQLYKAALEWDLIDPIIIEKREDFKSEETWKDKIEPFHHQVSNLITFCRRLPVTLLADDVGLGKTISAGLIASELIARGRLNKILIICPKILREQWQEELDTKFGIKSTIATGKDFITAQPPESIGAVITTYQTARMYLDFIKEANYEMLVLDEAHKLRNLFGVENVPQVALRFKKALADRMFKYVLMLTATPIQNRLWDLYSLVDLLTVARGHENPFGSEGEFARKFIADNRKDARKLHTHTRDEFRSIVYGYMSRVRRGDANLHFPERIVQLHSVDPTPEEIELINVIAEPIQLLNPLSQITILQSLISSPEALVSLLNGMARRNTAPEQLAEDVREVAKRIKITAKLKGLQSLVATLRKEKPETWRMVVFTTRRETQTTIQIFLEKQGITCGLINGDSSAKNQNTIARFKKNIPEVHVIISTEAGSEGVNLQAGNVLVNYDLPWNPMIVEQRIGRIQRLASNHATVCIFNIVLKGTFEENIVGRLMEKLQMASQAIGDIDALLEASGMDDESGANSFEEKIRQLVLSSLAGKNVEEATKKTTLSISLAKDQLENERKNIDTLLGSKADVIDRSPQSPQLPKTIRSLDNKAFVVTGLESLGAKLTPYNDDIYISEHQGKKELVRFDRPNSGENLNGVSHLASTFYTPGSAAFERLVSKLTLNGLHKVTDTDHNALNNAESTASDWVKTFHGVPIAYNKLAIERKFTGKALVRVRATVAHDSYERLIEIPCSPNDHFTSSNAVSSEMAYDTIENPKSIGVKTEFLIEKAKEDLGISEFCRFYTERRIIELQATGDDTRKKQKIEDDFTPRLEFSLVALDGNIFRTVTYEVTYDIHTGTNYTSTVTVLPSSKKVEKFPIIVNCQRTFKSIPVDCTEKCSISNKLVIKDYLFKSEVSGRKAMEEHTLICSVTGKRILSDEAGVSDVTGNSVSRELLKKSPISGKTGELMYFKKCAFTALEVLESELAISDVSNKLYRIDEKEQSSVSSLSGHKSEFIKCAESGKPLLRNEAEECASTGKVVLPGILEKCEISNVKVLPSELEQSSESGIKALKKFFVVSTVSNTTILEKEAIKSTTGKYCKIAEAKICSWSNQVSHPDDLALCHLTGLPVHIRYMSAGTEGKLETLSNLVKGISRKTDKSDLWSDIKVSIADVLGNKSIKIESSELSPNADQLAICVQVRTMLGLKIRHAGLIYSFKDKLIKGKVNLVKRETGTISEL